MLTPLQDPLQTPTAVPYLPHGHGVREAAHEDAGFVERLPTRMLMSGAYVWWLPTKRSGRSPGGTPSKPCTMVPSSSVEKNTGLESCRTSLHRQQRCKASHHHGCTELHHGFVASGLGSRGLKS